MHYREITPADDPALAELVRYNLKINHLDLPGTVYFDSNLDHLSDFYLADPAKRFYFILLDEEDRLVGGIGLAEFEHIDHCAELQKLYLSDEVKGHGLGYSLIHLVEEKAKELGYQKLYLETHTNLQTAIHMYEKSGFTEIEKPSAVMHATMNKFYIKNLG